LCALGANHLIVEGVGRFGKTNPASLEERKQIMQGATEEKKYHAERVLKKSYKLLLLLTVLFVNGLIFLHRKRRVMSSLHKFGLNICPPS
jgi:hypothetical protein